MSDKATIKDFVSYSSSIILALCAIIITFLVVKQEILEEKPNVAEVEYIEDWETLDVSEISGDPLENKVHIIEFYDYQCPFCKKVQPEIELLKEKFGRNISFSYAHYPLDYHKSAVDAAIAVECAGNQGKFSEYHNQLFQNQDSLDLGTLSFMNLASNVNVPNLDTFTDCFNNKETKNIVNAGIKLGRKIGVNSIPTFIINGQVYRGALPFDLFSQAIENVLDE